MSHCEVQISINDKGELLPPSEIPKVTFASGAAANPLLVTVQAEATGEKSWDFGDGTPRQSDPSQPPKDVKHEYLKPGKYTVTLRVVNGGRLSEFRADVVVSRSHSEHLRPPVTAFPTFKVIPGADPGFTRIECTLNTPATDPVVADWRIAKLPSQKGNKVTFDLEEGNYTLSFTAVRPLTACAYSKQRFDPNAGFIFNGLSLATNRRFDLDGNETTGTGTNPPANPFTTHLFSNGALSPADEWTIEIPLSDDNAFLRSVSATDVKQIDLSEIRDVILSLEYETTPGSS
jgi:hypothetical protein